MRKKQITKKDNSLRSKDQKSKKRNSIENLLAAAALAGIPESTKHDEIKKEKNKRRKRGGENVYKRKTSFFFYIYTFLIFSLLPRVAQ